MNIPEKGCILRVIIGERARQQGEPLYEWIVRQAREEGLAGATAYRGMMGFGANAKIKSASILCLSEDLPVVVELIDAREVLERFLGILDPIIENGLVTMEDLQVHMYRSKKS